MERVFHLSRSEALFYNPLYHGWFHGVWYVQNELILRFIDEPSGCYFLLIEHSACMKILK